VLSLATGHDVGYLTGAVGGGREGYYTGAVAAGEPPGLWSGAGAELLGLRGAVDAEQMEAVYTHLLDPRDPASASRATWGEATTLGKAHKSYRSAAEVYAAALEREPDAGPERRAELRANAERSARQAVSFIDATFSAPKSVSVLAVAFERAANDARAAGDEPEAEAWDAHAKAVEDAVMAGAQAALEYLQDKAGYARVGHHGGGAGRWIDAHRFVVAQFLQHDSRDRDPQLHVHQAILNRVLCADGAWRALDSRALHALRGAAAAIGERVMEAHLARSLGVRFETRPDGKAREVVGVRQQVMDLFSSRSRAIGVKAQRVIDAFRERFGREPAPLERTRIAQQATLATRAAKSHRGETEAQRLDRWEAEARTALAGGLAEVVRDVLDRAQDAGPAAAWSERAIVERAVAAVGDARQSWSRHDVLRYLSEALPGHLDLDPHEVRELLEALADRALKEVVLLGGAEPTEGLPAHLVLADGRSAYQDPSGARYATRGQLAADQVLRQAAVRRGAAALTEAEAAAVVARFAESGRELGADQAAALRGVLTSGAAVEVLSAAAGTGKSFTVGALREAWETSGRRVFGLAPSQVAAHVLTEEGLTARNVTDWLGAQRRLNEHRSGEADEGLRLHTGDLVVVDEAGMTSTPDLVAVHERCQAAGAKLLLVGDPRQLAAVGPGGTLADLGEHGIRYELAEVRRFTADWERHASLGLRDGDPAALETYQRHGRLIDGGTAEQTEAAAGRAWLADTLAGRESLLLVSSNEAAARVSAELRAQLVTLGHVTEQGVPLGRQGTVAGVGDLVQARRNGWELKGWEGNTRAPINRECYRVTAIREDGGLTVAPVHGRDQAGGEVLGAPLHLPAAYVAEDLTLGYASTVHAAQGRTVDTAHAVIGAGTDAAAAYVALTRGRERNTAWAVTRAVPEDAPTGQTHEVAPRTARAVLADVLDADRPQRAAPERSALAEQEHQAEAAQSMQKHLDRLGAEVADATAGRTGAWLDRLTAVGVLRDDQRVALAADEAYGSLERLLRTAELAGHDPAEVLENALCARPLDGAKSPARVVHGRIATELRGTLTPRLTSYADLIPAQLPDDTHARLQRLADGADDRRRELGERTAVDAPQWAREALGPVPDETVARAEWEHAAGWAAAHRELSGHTDEADPLGAAPPAGLAEQHAAWRAAHDALHLPETGGDEDELTDGQLRIRVRAMEREETWAPRYVGDELDVAEQAAQRHAADAQVWAARVDTAQDPAEARRLRAAAAAAQAEADALAECVADLDTADTARARWYAATAATRDTAARARGALEARGIDPDDPREQITAAEWLAAHRAEQAAEDAHRQVHDDADLHDPAREADRAATLATEWPQLETAIPDVRDVSQPDAAEHTDPQQPHRVPTVDETAEAVTKAQTALAEIAARRDADAAREAEEATRRDDLTRWSEQDQAIDQGMEWESSDALVIDR